MPAEARRLRRTPPSLRVLPREPLSRATPEQIKAMVRGHFRRIHRGKTKKPSRIPGKMEREITVRKQGVTTRVLHYSNGHQKWAVVSIEDDRTGGSNTFRLTARQYNEWLKRARGKAGERGLLTSIAANVVTHPDALAHGIRQIGAHGGKEILQTLFDLV